MGRAIRLVNRSAGSPALLCMMLVVIPILSASGQCFFHLSQSANDIKIASIGLPYGTCFSVDQQSIRQFSRVDLSIRDLPDSPGELDNSPDLALIARPRRPPEPESKVAWKEAIGESLLYTGIMHTFNIWTEPGTRDTLLGPWLQHYLNSVGELRGWSDSDRFMAPYVGHTIEGSAFGYIERQNNPR